VKNLLLIFHYLNNDEYILFCKTKYLTYDYYVIEFMQFQFNFLNDFNYKEALLYFLIANTFSFFCYSII